MFPLGMVKCPAACGHQGCTETLFLLEHGTVCPADEFHKLPALPVDVFPFPPDNLVGLPVACRHVLGFSAFHAAYLPLFVGILVFQ